MRPVLLSFFVLTFAGRAWAEEAGEQAKGKALFKVRCAICHGEAGAGDGPAAPYLTPSPRDLTREPFKSVTDEDGWNAGVRRVLRKGMPGSAMPRFGALREDEVAALLSFIRSLRPWDEKAQAQAEPTPEERGRLVYSKLQCAQCHGEDGAGDGPSAAELVDDQGRRSHPTDLRRPRSFRGGARREDLACAVRHGVHGTPMPACGEAMAPSELDDLLIFVESLFLQEPSR